MNIGLIVVNQVEVGKIAVIIKNVLNHVYVNICLDMVSIILHDGLRRTAHVKSILSNFENLKTFVKNFPKYLGLTGDIRLKINI